MPTWTQLQAMYDHLTEQLDVAQAFQTPREANGLRSDPEALVLGLASFPLSPGLPGAPSLTLGFDRQPPGG